MLFKKLKYNNLHENNVFDRILRKTYTAQMRFWQSKELRQKIYVKFDIFIC